MKKICIAILSLGLIVGGIIFFLQQNTSNKDLAITETEVNSSIHGIRKYDLTYQNLIDKGSSNVLIGTILGKELLNEDTEVYRVSVEEQVLGETNNEEILIYASTENMYEVGEKYYLILSEFNSSIYEKDFYVQDAEFVLKISDNGKLKRIINFDNKEYEDPFVDSKYNDVDELVLFTKKNFPEKNPSNSKTKEKIDSTQMLVDQSDHVIEINVLDVVDTDNGLAIVDFEIIKSYKNGNLDNGASIHGMILPQKLVSQNMEYLVFLTERADTSVTLTTRENSIFAKNDESYNSIVKEIDK